MDGVSPLSGPGIVPKPARNEVQERPHRAAHFIARLAGEAEKASRVREIRCRDNQLRTSYDLLLYRPCQKPLGVCSERVTDDRDGRQRIVPAETGHQSAIRGSKRERIVHQQPIRERDLQEASVLDELPPFARCTSSRC